MPDILFFDNSGQSKLNLVVPDNKRLYICRPPQQAQGTLTVHNFESGKTYQIPNGEAVYDTCISGTRVSLAFVGRTGTTIDSLTVEITHKRS